MIDLNRIEGFDWDKGNREKNWLKHNVATGECEQIFFNAPLLLLPADPGRSPNELRYYALGQTDSDRNLFIVFTVRDNKIRVISARDMSREERSIYATTNP